VPQAYHTESHNDVLLALVRLAYRGGAVFRGFPLDWRTGREDIMASTLRTSRTVGWFFLIFIRYLWSRRQQGHQCFEIN